jgi:glycosyltransferase involved in cell wall biosynthesis
MSAGYDYVVFGTVPWDSPWLTEQNLAHALGRSRRVLYVEPPTTMLAPLRYGLRRQTAAELRRLARRSLRRSGRIHVLRSVVLPPREHPRARAASAPLLRAQVRRAVARLGLERPVAVAARGIPDMRGAAGERACVYVIKDLVEADGDLIGKDSRKLAKDVRRMCADADLICVISSRLRDTFAERGVAASLLPHGFHAELASLYDAPPPSDLDQLPRPRLGYAGRIDGRLDFDALRALARRFGTGSLVLVGPVSPRLRGSALAALRRLPNVHMLGTRTRHDLPAYLANFDCALMPYREGAWAHHGSPLKLWDYLYAGPPLVGSGYSALGDYEPLVRFVSGSAAFAAAVQQALRDPQAGREERRAFALANSWDKRAAQLEALVEEHLRVAARRGDVRSAAA